MKNIFSDIARPEPDSPERFEPLLTGMNGLVVERIVSHGHTTPDGQWYDQERDEWVLVLEGEAHLAYPDGSMVALAVGDSLLLPKHEKHRVSYTTSPCVWLAVHAATLDETS